MRVETRRFGTTPGLTKTKALTLELNYTPLGEGADGAVCGRRHATDLALRAPPQQGGFFFLTPSAQFTCFFSSSSTNTDAGSPDSKVALVECEVAAGALLASLVF